MELLNIKNYVKERKKHSKGVSITIFQVRDNPASERYVRNKIKDMDEVSIAHRLYKVEKKEDTGVEEETEANNQMS